MFSLIFLGVPPGDGLSECLLVATSQCASWWWHLGVPPGDDISMCLLEATSQCTSWLSTSWCAPLCDNISVCHLMVKSQCTSWWQHCGVPTGGDISLCASWWWLLSVPPGGGYSVCLLVATSQYALWWHHSFIMETSSFFPWYRMNKMLLFLY